MTNQGGQIDATLFFLPKPNVGRLFVETDAESLEFMLE